MNTSQLSLIPLQQATLCIDCDMITASQTRCAVCGSVALMNLARTLNGVENESPAPQNLMVVPRISRTQHEPLAFRTSVSHRRHCVRARGANLERVLFSLLMRPARRRASARKYGTWSWR